MDRIKKLCAFLDECESFADVGCDHGYCTRYMLERKLCKRAVAADISEKCLDKTRTLLAPYISSGELETVCCDGLEKISPDTEQVLIAGMGGEEIAGILSRAFVPKKFVLQPMRNARSVREFLIERGAKITCDTVFESGGKYYFVIKGESSGGTENYSEAMLEYGELSSPILKKFLGEEHDKKREYLTRGLSRTNRERIENEIEFIKGILSGEIN